MGETEKTEIIFTIRNMKTEMSVGETKRITLGNLIRDVERISEDEFKISMEVFFVGDK